ncbi:MAG: hypothetical protein QJR02_14240 [Sinobacteraceae bacterium]|nr:hypothetical protein [Nevskiaceae bacterium]
MRQKRGKNFFEPSQVGAKNAVKTGCREIFYRVFYRVDYELWCNPMQPEETTKSKQDVGLAGKKKPAESR